MRYEFGGLIRGGAYFRNFTVLCPRFEHNYFTKLDNAQKMGIGVKQFVLILSYRPLHTFSRTLSCSMDANLVVDRR